MKRTIPLLITAAVGFILVLAYFVPFFGNLGELAAIHFDILAAVAFILGGGNLLRTHGEKIYKRHAGWAYSVIAVVCFLLTLGFGLFKVGVTPVNQGFWTDELMRNGRVVGFAQLDIKAAAHSLVLQVQGAEPGGQYPIFIGDHRVGTLEIDERGRGEFALEYNAESGEQGPGAALAQVHDGETLRVGSLLTGRLHRYSRITGEYNDNGSFFWWMYEYGFQPLQQTTFAMLAFYVASAAFRAFRARNIESVMLLGTAFIILLGRTYAGTWLTQWAADPVNNPRPDSLWEQFLSFWYMPYLTEWIMDVLNTAGNRAIMIGIALGVASTSLKVLLGIDRSYLGSDRG